MANHMPVDDTPWSVWVVQSCVLVWLLWSRLALVSLEETGLEAA